MQDKEASVDDSDENGKEEKSMDQEDDDSPDDYRDPPEEYPPELLLKRSDVGYLQKLEGGAKLSFRSHWERICIRNAFHRAGFSKSDKSWTALWDKHLSDGQLKDLKCIQKVNHFPSSWCIGRKDRLSRTLSYMKRLHAAEFSFHPECFIMPSDKEALSREIALSKEKGRRQGSLWIMKPVASSCGRGIKVLTGEQAAASMKTKAGRKALFQRYLDDPYLIDGKKFDLRIYVLVTGVEPLRVYIHKEGLCRISTENYSLKNTSNRFAHLTNYSINKHSSHFKAADLFQLPPPPTSSETGGDDAPQSGDDIKNGECDGFKWSLTAFRSWLSKRESKERVDETFRRIYDVCVKTMIAAESEITPRIHALGKYRTNCYELFGCDVFLDRHLTPHLIEVNVSPSLMGSSPLDKQIKGTLMADVFHVVGLYPWDPEVITKYSAPEPDDLYGMISKSGRVLIKRPVTAGIVAGALNRRGRVALAIATSKKYATVGERRKNHAVAARADRTCLASEVTGGQPLRLSPSSASPRSEGDYVNEQPMGKNREILNTRAVPLDSISPSNPFYFLPISLLLQTQEKWRREQLPENVDLAAVGSLEDELSDSLWIMLMMIEDEFNRAAASLFCRVHPTSADAAHYCGLYRNSRFADHVLAYWVSQGATKWKFIPRRFLHPSSHPSSASPIPDSLKTRSIKTAIDKARITDFNIKTLRVSAASLTFDNHAAALSHLSRIASIDSGAALLTSRSAGGAYTRPSSGDTGPASALGRTSDFTDRELKTSLAVVSSSKTNSRKDGGERFV